MTCRSVQCPKTCTYGRCLHPTADAGGIEKECAKKRNGVYRSLTHSIEIPLRQGEAERMLLCALFRVAEAPNEAAGCLVSCPTEFAVGNPF